MLADMIELVDHYRAMFMTSIGDAAEGRDDGIVAMAEIAPRQNRRSMDWDRFDHDHPRTTSGAFAIVAKMPITWQPGFGHIRGVSAKVQAVFERLVTKVEGLEQMWK